MELSAKELEKLLIDDIVDYLNWTYNKFCYRDYLTCINEKKKSPLIAMACSNKDFVLKLVNKNYICLDLLSSEMLNDDDVIFSAIKGCKKIKGQSEFKHALDYFIKKYQCCKIANNRWQDFDFVNKVIACDIRFFAKACYEYENEIDVKKYSLDKSAILEIIDTARKCGLSGLATEFAQLAETKEDALLYVMHGASPSTLPEQYKEDSDIQLEYLKKCNHLYEISDKFWNDEHFVSSALDIEENKEKIAKYIEEKGLFKNNPDVVLKIAKNLKEISSDFLKERDDKIKDNTEIVSTLVGKNGLVLEDASQRMQTSDKIVFKAILNDKYALMYASPKLLCQKKFEMKVLKAVPKFKAPLIEEQQKMIIEEKLAIERHGDWEEQQKRNRERYGGYPSQEEYDAYLEWREKQ